MENYLKGLINFKRENEFTNYFDSLNLKNLEKNELSCDYCGCVREDFDLEEDVVCGKCGTLFEPNIDSSAEYRFFGAEDRSSTDPCRVGAPTDSRLPQ